MSNKPKQRFVDLDVGEVSIVDSPANESEFVVIKNLNNDEFIEEVKMSETDVEKNVDDKNINDEKTPTPERVPVEVVKAVDVTEAAALGKVTELIGNISKAIGAIGTKNGESDKTTNTTNTPEETVENTKKGKAEEEEQTTETQSNDVEKSMEATLEAMSFMIEKAKRMTPKREDAMKTALATLNNLAKEMGMEEIPTNSSPNVKAPSGVSFGSSSITKALTELTGKLEEMLTTVNNTTKSLGERVEKIEKARMPSKSVEDDGGTDSNSKVQKSFWQGVL